MADDSRLNLPIGATCFMPTSTNCVQLDDTINGVSVSKSFQRFSV